jgi:hypothetical protein
MLFCCIMTFFSTTSSLALPLVTVNKTTKPHIPQNNGLHCCQTVHNRRKPPLNLTNYQPCTQRKKSHIINVSRRHVFQVVLNFHGFRPQSFSLIVCSYLARNCTWCPERRNCMWSASCRIVAGGGYCCTGNAGCTRRR